MAQRQAVRLTPRETEVLASLLQGDGNKLIAAELGLAEQSVTDHVSALLAKFGVANRAALAVEAGTPLAEAGAVSGVLSFAFDVTEQVGARDRAEIVCDEVAAILDLVPDGVIVTDERGRIVKANAEAARIARTHLDPTSSIDDQGVAIFHVRDASGRRLAVHELPVRRALNGETLCSAPYLFDGGDPSREIRVRMSAKPIRAADGRIRGAVLPFTETDDASPLPLPLVESSSR